MKISNEAMMATYDVAKRIREGALSRAAGIEELYERFGLNRSSAGDTITTIVYMLKGKRYVRTNRSFVNRSEVVGGIINPEMTTVQLEKHVWSGL